MMSREEITESEEQTLQLAAEFAKELQAGDLVCLQGELGSGKTRFVKGVASQLGIDPSEVLSPTFTLINEYSGTLPLYHFDCYRMESPEEALEIGAEEYFYGEGVSIIEWPEKIAPLIPGDAIWIHIESVGPTRRRFIFDNRKN